MSATVGGASVTYAYDGDGFLSSRTQGAATTAYLWDTSSAPAPLLGAGTDRVVHGLGPLYRALADGSYRVFVRDALGSVRAEVAGSGFVTGVFDYLSYGEPRGAPYQVPPLLGFTGELRDSVTGLLYLRARWYDPSSARFIARDSFPGSSLVPASLNAYAYVLAQPTLSGDPTGHFPPLILAALPIVWAGIEAALSVGDAVATAITVADPKSTTAEKLESLAFFAIGAIGPGGGAAAARRIAKRTVMGDRAATVSGILDEAERWLGPGYREIGPGAFRSADGARQFRMTDADILDPRMPHVNLEKFAPDGRRIENVHVRLLDR